MPTVKGYFLGRGLARSQKPLIFFVNKSVFFIFKDQYTEQNSFNQQKWQSRIANCICCQLNTIRNRMNNFTDWKQNTTKCIHLIMYNIQLTTHAVGHPQMPIFY